MEFAEKLRELVATKYPKIGVLADKFEMNYTQLSQYLNGRKPSIEFLNKIIVEFPDTDLNWLLRNDTEKITVSEPEKTYKKPQNSMQIVMEIEELISDLKKQLPQN